MRFLTITLENVKNAAMIFVGTANKAPWNGQWTYSSAYARLFAIAKAPGFMGYITMDNNGLPCGFIMGNMKNRSDGRNDFRIQEICYPHSPAGDMYAKKTIEHMTEQLVRQHVIRIVYIDEGGEGVSSYFDSLNFTRTESVVAAEKVISNE